MADLAIEDVTAPESIEGGTELSIGFTIRNVGEAPSGPFAYFYSGPDLETGGTKTVDGLLPGEYLVDSADLGDADYFDGVVTVWVVVDPADGLAESDESNNEGSRQIQVNCADSVLCP